MASLPKLKSIAGHPWQVLPEGVHPCDEPAMQDRFVEPFSASKTRPNIFGGFLRLRRAATQAGLSATQWVDGSFVESKPDPNDVDVVTYADYDALNAMSGRAQRTLDRLLSAGELTKAEFDTHTFFVPSCSKGHPFHSTYEEMRRYWRKWFGTTRSGRAKGIASKTLGDNTLAPTISVEASN